jgi:hypothetical protein
MNREQEAEYFATHCASCGKKDGRIVRVYCGECFHPYYTPLGLIWHDMKVRMEINWKKPKYEPSEGVIIWDDMVPQKWKYRLKSLIPRRFKNIYVCPCCVHDL